MQPPESTPVFFPEFDFADGSQPLLQLRACRPNGLLPCPAAPGWSLDVNDLLIIHPDADKGDSAYTRSQAPSPGQARHAPRCTEQAQPLGSIEDVLGRESAPARRQAQTTLVLTLERIYARFLERFGPRGLFTPFGVSLIAPKFRDEARDDSNDTDQDAKDYLDGSYGSVIIPEEILRGVAAMRDDWDGDDEDKSYGSIVKKSLE
ncbi:uncharacterized protein IAS62_001823 [Cryptococcus decagattii]|uniref:Uncharacterized protein n=1 Tax=Cryptococcus decagattii TaxID=1859122 RepID=A0ABZ2AT72_9TREE